MNPHYKTLQLGFAKTLVELRKQSDVVQKIDSQITFWHTVENVMELLKTSNATFDKNSFVDGIMSNANIPLKGDTVRVMKPSGEKEDMTRTKFESLTAVGLSLTEVEHD